MNNTTKPHRQRQCGFVRIALQKVYLLSGQRGRKISRLGKPKTGFAAGRSPLVEARGVEPLSESRSVRLSTRLVGLFYLPRDSPIDRIALWQLFEIRVGLQSSHPRRWLLCHAQTEAAALIGRTSCTQAANAYSSESAFNFNLPIIKEFRRTLRA